VKLIKKILLGALIVCVVFLGYSYLRFDHDLSEEINALSSNSELQSTYLGDIEYILKGDTGPIVLFLHGMPGGYDQAPDPWPGYRLLAPSRPGYLRTSIEVGDSPERQAISYLALLDSLEIENVIVFGVSGGGPSAIEFAEKFPERTDALILMEAISQRFPNNGEMSSLMTSDFLYWSMFNALLSIQGLEGVAAMQIEDPSQRLEILNDPGKSQKFERILWSVWPGSLREEGWKNDMLQVDRLSEPPEISVPTLIIHGAKDATVPVDHSRKLAAQVSNSELHVFEDATHLMPLTHEVQVRDLALDFLSKYSL